MRCTQYREALSARLDGEPTGLADDLLDHHVAACRDCARWGEDAARLHRMTRIAPADPVPDRTPRLVTAAVRLRGQPSFTAMLARAGLAAVGIAQLVWALAALLAETDSMSSPRHVMHEFAAWNAAIAVGFLAVVLRTRLSAGLLPALSAFVVILTGVCIVDFSTGHVHLERITSHLLILAGLILVVVLHVTQRGPRRPGLGGRRTRWGAPGAGRLTGGAGSVGASRPDVAGRSDVGPAPATSRTVAGRDASGAA